jgi:leucyl-tRNA synthetase
VHRAIADVRVEMEHMRSNTAIAKLIALNNHLTGLDRVPREAIEPLILMVAPIAPHIAEELWSRLGHPRSLAHEPFPVALDEYLVEDTVTCVVQVQGKVRSRLEVSPSIGDDELRELALADANVQRTLDGRGIRTVIVRAPKLVNVVPA